MQVPKHFSNQTTLSFIRPLFGESVVYSPNVLGKWSYSYRAIFKSHLNSDHIISLGCVRLVSALRADAEGIPGGTGAAIPSDVVRTDRGTACSSMDPLAMALAAWVSGTPVDTVPIFASSNIAEASPPLVELP